MPFNTLMAFGRSRLARVGLGLLVLTGAALAEYELANVPLPVDLETTGKFSPATIRLGREELVIEGPVVHSSAGMLLSHDGRENETVDVRFDRAKLDQQTIRLLESVGSSPPSGPDKIDYRPDQPKRPLTSDEPCQTRVELLASKMPSEIHLFQLGDPGLNHYRHLEIRTTGAELTSNLMTVSPDDSDLGPGCQYLLKVGDWSEPVNKIVVTSIVTEGSGFRLYFRPLKADSTPWADAEGVLRLDLGGAQKVNPNDPPPFQAHAVSVRSLGGGNPGSVPPALLSARSTDGTLLSINDLRIDSDQVQISVAGNGWLTINGKAETINFLRRAQENSVLLALLAAFDTALLAWVARLIFKTPPTTP